MGFIDIPTEQTTAFTDLVLSILAVGFAFYLARSEVKVGSRFRTRIWTMILLFLGLSAGLGAVAHGFEMSDSLNRSVWHPLNLGLGMTIAFFVIAVIHDISGKRRAKKLIPVMVTVSLLFFLVTVFIPGSFLVFIIYEALAMLGALISYFLLTIRKKLPGSGLITMGILLTIIAAGVQASESVEFTLIWEFDHNGLFHIIQMMALPFLVFGATRSKEKGEQREE
ncbi:MAG: DUF6962 family protein [Thermoplasmatota archaeon]